MRIKKLLILFLPLLIIISSCGSKVKYESYDFLRGEYEASFEAESKEVLFKGTIKRNLDGSFIMKYSEPAELSKVTLKYFDGSLTSLYEGLPPLEADTFVAKGGLPLMLMRSLENASFSLLEAGKGGPEGTTESGKYTLKAEGNGEYKLTVEKTVIKLKK